MSEEAEVYDGCCSSCQFWERYGGDDLFYGVCKRYPPVLSDDAVKFYRKTDDSDTEEVSLIRSVRGPNVWFSPVTGADDWCGEWQAKPANSLAPGAPRGILPPKEGNAP
jgi:hypothetical protein